jgi:hypothetical protein
VDDTVEQYFYITDSDVKIVMWGKNTTQDEIDCAFPVAIFPQAVTEDIVKDFYALLLVKDPEGKIGQAVKTFVEEQMKNMKNGPEFQGLEAGESIEGLNPEDLSDLQGDLPVV